MLTCSTSQPTSIAITCCFCLAERTGGFGTLSHNIIFSGHEVVVNPDSGALLILDMKRRGGDVYNPMSIILHTQTQSTIANQKYCTYMVITW